MKTRIVIATLISISLTPGAAIATEAAEPTKHVIHVTTPSFSSNVTVERIDIRGDSSLPRDVILSAIDVKPGEAVAREELDAALTRGEQRIRALGQFRTVDIRLEKGAKRGSFVIAIELTEHTKVYSGVSFSHQRYRKERDNPPKWSSSNRETERTGKGSAFVGTRDGFGKGTRIDFELTHSDQRDESESSVSTDRDWTGALAIMQPEIGGSPAFAGLGLIESRGRSRYKFESRFSDYISSSKGHNRFFVVQPQLGARFGLFKIAASVMRIGFKSEFTDVSYDDGKIETDSNAWRGYFTGANLNLRWSQKSYRVAVEPGSAVQLDYDRFAAPEINPPQIRLKALHTWLPVERHALTADGSLKYEWSENTSSSSDSSGNVTSTKRTIELERFYDVSLLYQFATPWDWVLGIQQGLYGQINQPPRWRWEKLPAWRTRLSALYVTPWFIADLGVMVGHPGMSEDFLPSGLATERTKP